MKILHIDSSLKGNTSTSSKIATKLIEKLDVENAQQQKITYRDLNISQVPHLSDAIFNAFHTPESERTIEQQAAAAVSDELIDEVNGSDILIIAVPMYNFGVPSTLKAWIDHIARAGKTFTYTAKGPKPLLKMPKTYVIATRGGLYANTPADTQAPWIEQVLKFVGVPEVEFIFVEGVAMHSADDVLINADARIKQLLSA